MAVVLISSYELKGEIQNMKMRKSTGLDKISTKLIKQAGDTITGSLLEVFINLSLGTGIFPDDWKFAKVTPIYRVSQKKSNHLIFRDILFVFKHKRFYAPVNLKCLLTVQL
jgi:hypothetical protein